MNAILRGLGVRITSLLGNRRKRIIALAIVAGATLWSSSSDVSDVLELLLRSIIEQQEHNGEDVFFKPESLGDGSNYLA
jgi:hypothetical protein